MIDQLICGLSVSTQQKLISVFQKHNGIEKVVIYGSRAKGNYKPGSDIDMTIYGPEMTMSELLKIEDEIDDLLLPYKVDLALFHLIDNPQLVDHNQRLGLLLYPEIKAI